MDIRFATFPAPRPGVIVASHERSGTHFLMNSLASGYGYTVRPRVDLDPMWIPLDDRDPGAIEGFLDRLAVERSASIVKSHHAVEFFEDVLDRIIERYIVFYIYRDPVDVMLSFFRFIHSADWGQEARRSDPVAFALHRPEGAMRRYERRQHDSLLHRWQDHVEGWVSAAATRTRVVLVRYEDLRDNFEETMSSFAGVLGAAPSNVAPPPPDLDTIQAPGHGLIGALSRAGPFVSALRDSARQAVGTTMGRLGYA